MCLVVLLVSRYAPYIHRASIPIDWRRLKPYFKQIIIHYTIDNLKAGDDDMKKRFEKTAENIHSTLIEITKILGDLGLKVFIIGARSVIIHGVHIGRETRDWDIVIDKSFSPELRDTLTRIFRKKGFRVQWRKWGFLVEDDIHVDINYPPLILDDEFIRRAKQLKHGIYLPSLEDIIILKLMSGERKDINDVKKILHQTWSSLDKEYLYRRAKEAGLSGQLNKILRRLRLK